MYNKKDFYKKMAEKSLKNATSYNVKYKKRTKTKQSTNITKNGMIKFEQEEKKPKFFLQSIICCFIICIFLMLSNSDLHIAQKITNTTKNILNTDFNILEKITDIVPVFNIIKNDKNGVSIDKNVIEQMEEEIENTPKK